jgi:hypothetical protein
VVQFESGKEINRMDRMNRMKKKEGTSAVLMLFLYPDNPVHPV